MPARLVLLVALALACPPAAAGQTAQSPDGIGDLLARLESLLEGGDATGFAALTAGDSSPEQIAQFAADVFQPGIVRAFVNERDRSPLDGVAAGAGYRLVVEMFTETAGRARILTTLLDVRRAEASGSGWRITAAQGLTTVEGLYRLRINTTTRYVAQGLTITATDLAISMARGTVYHVESDAGITGLVLLGRGTMRFAPPSTTEQGQLRIFADAEILEAQFDSVFIRLHPSQYEQRVSVDGFTAAPPDARQARQAQELFARESQKSFSLDLTGLSTEQWHLLPQPGDFLAEVRTRRHGLLTYTRSLTQAEDVSLFDRARQKTVSAYPSAERVAARGAAYNEDDFRDYDVIDYDVDASITPLREHLEARVRVRLRIRTPLLSALTLRLADALTVASVTSPEYGRLLHIRVRGQNSVIVNLPAPPAEGSELTLVVAYAGTVASQEIEDDAVQVGDSGAELSPVLEPKLLLSSRSYWYPQNPVTDYATASMRITVPDGYGCIATGEPRRDDAAVTLRDLLTLTKGTAFVFTARQPLRYLAVVVSRFVRVAEATIDVPDRDAPGGTRPMRLAVDANPQLQGVGRNLFGEFQAIMRFYAGLLGQAPYESATLGVVEHELPGGHSPGFFVVLNAPIFGARAVWRDDPAAFNDFPEYFLAHELAHQWWGQAVGWRNYHEQWLSEGFAQYFAALYARQARGERVFQAMVRQFGRWALRESDEGPVDLGYRLGHIRSQPRVFRAVVYNKGAAVLHMLRRLIGDEHFFGGLRRYYTEQRFQKASTDVLRRAFEAESGRSLDRFFDRWIHGAEVPRVMYATVIDTGSVTVSFEQTTEAVFDLPVTVTLTYVDGRTQDTTVTLTERQVEWRMPTTRPVRRIQVNRDSAAIGRFDSE